MRPHRAKLLTLAVYAATAIVPSTLSASSCNNPIVVPIKIQIGRALLAA
jgi:hypothetical protein